MPLSVWLIAGAFVLCLMISVLLAYITLAPRTGAGQLQNVVTATPLAVLQLMSGGHRDPFTEQTHQLLDSTRALDSALGRPVATGQQSALSGSVGSFAGQPRPAPQPSAVPGPGGKGFVPVAPVEPPAQQPAAGAAPGPSPGLPPGLGYSIQYGFFLSGEAAAAFVNALQSAGIAATQVVEADDSGRVWTYVRSPPFSDSAAALTYAAQVERDHAIAGTLVLPSPPPAAAPGGAAPPTAAAATPAPAAAAAVPPKPAAPAAAPPPAAAPAASTAAASAAQAAPASSAALAPAAPAAPAATTAPPAAGARQ